MWIPYPTTEETAAINELYSGSDRAAAIVAAAIVEQRLTIFLKTTLLDDRKVFEQLFGPLRPLNSFSAKIKIGYLSGYYRKLFYGNLESFREVRNRFAHSLICRFELQEIADRCKNLVLVDRVYREAKVAPPNTTGMFVSDDEFAIKRTDPMRSIDSSRQRYLAFAELVTIALATPEYLRHPVLFADT